MEIFLSLAAGLVIGFGIGTAFGQKAAHDLHAKVDALRADIKAKL